MAMDHSLTMIVPVSDVAAANAYAVAMNWGPIFSVDLSPNGQLPVTHKGCHQFQTAEFVATLEAAKASVEPALAALDSVFIHGEASQSPLFETVLQSSEIEAVLGTKLAVYYPPQEV